MYIYIYTVYRPGFTRHWFSILRFFDVYVCICIYLWIPVEVETTIYSCFPSSQLPHCLAWGRCSLCTLFTCSHHKLVDWTFSKTSRISNIHKTGHGMSWVKRSKHYLSVHRSTVGSHGCSSAIWYLQLHIPMTSPCWCITWSIATKLPHDDQRPPLNFLVPVDLWVPMSLDLVKTSMTLLSYIQIHCTMPWFAEKWKEFNPVHIPRIINI